MRTIPRPQPGEYSSHAKSYIDLVSEDDAVLHHMRDNVRRTTEFILSIPETKLLHRYAPGKWTIKEIVAHIVDDERVYAYRALRFARGDKTELPGFDQDRFAAWSGANERRIKDILEELGTVRSATISLFEGLPEDALMRSGVADGSVVTVRALAYHIAGHELRHIAVIRERYLAP